MRSRSKATERIRLSSLSVDKSGSAIVRIVAKVATATRTAAMLCGSSICSILISFDPALPYMSKLIIFFMMKMPVPIQNTQPASTMCPVEVVNSSEM